MPVMEGCILIASGAPLLTVGTRKPQGDPEGATVKVDAG